MKRDIVVGVIFLLGILVVGVFTIVVKDISFLQGRKGQLKVIFKKVAGLEVGHKVLASGMEVGFVSDLQLNQDGKVKAVLNLTKPIELKNGYKIAVKDTSALGGKYVDIELGKSAENISLAQPLQGETQASIFDDPNLREIFKSVKKIAKNIEEGNGTIGLLIKQRDIYDNLKAASKNIRDITDQMRSTQSTIGKLLYDGELYDKINNIVDDIQYVTASVRSGKGTIGKLIKEDKLYNNLNNTLTDANKVFKDVQEIVGKVKNGEGTVGKLFTDDKVYTKLDGALGDARAMLQNINKVATSLNEGKGTLGKLLKDEEMASSLKDTLTSLKVVAQRLKKGEGTIGRLMADDELYKELKRVLKNFSDSIEDTREQVPITTFTNILFKAF